MAKVFISYRRADSAASSGRIYDRMVVRFKRRNIFKDVDNIPAGVDFGAYIQQSLRQCAVMLVVIGPHWLDTRATDGSRRLDDPADSVRIEIETALRLGLTVIPLLVEGAPIPVADQLPASLREVARLNALPVRNDPDFAHDMERVIAAVQHAPTPTRDTRGVFRRRLVQSTDAPGQSSPALPVRPAADPRSATPLSAVAGEQPNVLLRQSAAPGRSRVRGIAIAALAMALVVTSFGVLLSRGVIPISGSASHKPTATATTRPLPTATPKPILTHSLVIALPGPDECAQASKMSFSPLTWLEITGADTVDCSNGRATRIFPGSCNCGVYDGELDFIPEDSGIYLPPAYTVSVKISGLTAITTAHLFLMNARGTNLYDIGLVNNLQYTGHAYFKVSDSACSYQPCMGDFVITRTNTLAFQVTQNTITALLNGAPVGSKKLDSTQTIEGVGLGVGLTEQGIGYTGKPYHADFSNLTITPS